jgi:hypothetical protein
MPCFQAILPDRGLELTIPRSRLMNELMLRVTIRVDGAEVTLGSEP